MFSKTPSVQQGNTISIFPTPSVQQGSTAVVRAPGGEQERTATVLPVLNKINSCGCCIRPSYFLQKHTTGDNINKVQRVFSPSLTGFFPRLTENLRHIFVSKCNCHCKSQKHIRYQMSTEKKTGAYNGYHNAYNTYL